MRALGPLLAALAVLVPGAAAAPLPAGWDASRFMALDEIRPGMKGVGRSVFHGSAIEEFAVEILGVLPTASPGGEMILARLAGRGLEESGIIAGMSGSPIFIEGRLIGALAFGWSFSTQPITGITPIAEMLRLREKSGGGTGGDAGPRNTGLDPDTWIALWSAPAGEVLDRLLPAPPAGRSDLPSPIRTPVQVAGLGSAAGGELARCLEPLGFTLVQGGATGSAAARPVSPLEPGSAVGVELVRGDAQIAAVGTVTWVEGSDVFAFGHPMLSRGGSEYPMANAEIVTVMPRASSSFKMGVVGPEIGVIQRDYRPGVMGTVGPRARLIPVRLEVKEGERVLPFTFEILDASALTPALAGIVAVNVMEATGAGVTEVTLEVESTLELADGRSLVRRNLLAGFSPPGELAGEVARTVALVHGNPHEDVKIASIGVRVAVAEEVRASFLDRVDVDPGPWRPGQTIPVRVSLRDYRGGSRRHETSLTLPAALPAGTYDLRVCDGNAANEADRGRAPAVYFPRDVSRLLVLLGDEHPGDALVVSLLGAGSNPVVAGRELPGLPASLRGALAGGLASGRTTVAQSTVLAQRVDRLGRLLIGCHSVAVRVQP